MRFEGPIVDSLYDMALIAWGIALDPPLPMIDTPASTESPPSYAAQNFEKPSQVKKSQAEGAKAAR